MYRRACRRRLAAGVGIHFAAGATAYLGQPWAAFWALNTSWALGVGATLHPNDSFFGPVMRRRGHLHKIWLTIDDGPDPETTPALLDLLAEHRHTATFFLIGNRAEQHPDIVRRIVAEGHEIGNHTQTHPQGRFWSLGPKRIWEEIAVAQETLKQITGITPVHFRAPVGHANPFVHPAADALGLRVTGWTSRGYDAVERDHEKILSRIQKTLKPGGTLLIHDATPVAADVLEGSLNLLDRAV